MSTWLEILNTKQTETNKTKTSRHSAHSSVPSGSGGGGGGASVSGVKQSNRRQKRLRKHSGNPSVQITAGKSSSSSANKTPGLLQSLTSKLTGTEDSVRYVALNQSELEKGPNHSAASSLNYDSDRDYWDNSSNSSPNLVSSNSSSEEDLFVTSSRRKQQQQKRRKMTRKGTYSMRETFENSRQVSNLKYITCLVSY